MTDIEIAKKAKLLPIEQIAKKAGFDLSDIENYGKYKAKINLSVLDKTKVKQDAKLILVTAISPTPAGEGKSTVSVGLSDALNYIGKKTTVVLREPSLGPVFGIKGGATGGGYAQVVPMDEINLHFTGDFHAIGAANNLLAAMIDNHIYHGNTLEIVPETIIWRRCMDMNDRAIRDVTIGLESDKSVTRSDHFDITVASETMAIFCLANSLEDLKKRLGDIIIGYNKKGKPVTAAMLKANGAMSALLKDAIKPNLVQTLENNPAIIHGGPFANIAHGCNSIIATKLASKISDYCVTEAGFAADLGAEKFLNIKCRMAGLKPNCVVLVATIRALKYHGEGDITKGLPNMLRHIENIKKGFSLPCVVAINKFLTDTDEEMDIIKKACEKVGVPVRVCDVWANGGKGGAELAKEVVNQIQTNKNTKLTNTYDLNQTIEQKISAIATKIYRADKVIFSDEAKAKIKAIEKLGYKKLPVCIAKTQKSFSDDDKLICAPTGFNITVRDVKLCAGAGFVVALTGKILTMPGLPVKPAAEVIDVDKDGNIVGLF